MVTSLDMPAGLFLDLQSVLAVTVSASLFELMQRGWRTGLFTVMMTSFDMPAGLLLDLQLASTVTVRSSLYGLMQRQAVKRGSPNSLWS
jgi:hypothetical protein